MKCKQWSRVLVGQFYRSKWDTLQNCLVLTQRTSQWSNGNLVTRVISTYLVHLHSEVGNEIGQPEANPIKFLVGHLWTLKNRIQMDSGIQQEEDKKMHQRLCVGAKSNSFRSERRRKQRSMPASCRWRSEAEENMPGRRHPCFPAKMLHGGSFHHALNLTGHMFSAVTINKHDLHTMFNLVVFSHFTNAKVCA